MNQCFFHLLVIIQISQFLLFVKKFLYIVFRRPDNKESSNVVNHFVKWNEYSQWQKQSYDANFHDVLNHI